MRFPTMVALILMALLPPGLSASEAGDYRVAITPLVGYRMGGSFDAEEGNEEVSLDDDAVVGLIVNLPAERVRGDDYTEWELYVSRQSVGLDDAPAGVDPGLDIDISHVLLGGTYVGAGQGASYRPYLAAGIGAAHLSPDDSGYSSDTVFAFGVGGGAQLFPADRIGVRLEARVLGSVIDSDTSIFCRSDSEGAACAFRASGDILWQWEVFAGLTARF